MGASTRFKEQVVDPWRLAIAHRAILKRLRKRYSDDHWHPSTLAEAVGMDKGRMSRTLRSLTQAGLVDLEPCTEPHHLGKAVWLTSRGARILAVLERTVSGAPPEPHSIPEADKRALETLVRTMRQLRAWDRRSEAADRLARSVEGLSGTNYFAMPAIREGLVHVAEQWYPSWRRARGKRDKERTRSCRVLGRVLLRCFQDSTPHYRSMWAHALSPIAQNLCGEERLHPEACDWALAVLPKTLESSGRYPYKEFSTLLRLTPEVSKWPYGGPSLTRLRGCLEAIEDDEQRVQIRSRLEDLLASGVRDERTAIEGFLAPLLDRWGHEG